MKVTDNHRKLVVGLDVGIMSVLFLMTAFLRLYEIGDVPYGMHIDEAGMAYDAWCLANYGVDRWLNKFPVYLVNFGGGQSSLLAYLCALLIKINGGNVTTVIVRLPGVILNLCAWCAGVQIIKKQMGRFWSILGAFLLCIMPYFILQCRIGLDCNLLVSMLTISVYVLMIAVEKKKIIWYTFAGILWGLTYYTYSLSYLPNTCAILLITLALLAQGKINRRQVVAWWIPVILMGLPLFGMICVNQFQLNSIQIFGITIPRLPAYRVGEFVLNKETLLANFKTELSDIFTYDLWHYNSFPEFYNFYKISPCFLFVGMVGFFAAFVKKIMTKNLDSEMMIGVLWLLYFGEGLLLGEAGPNINKLNGLMFCSFYFLVYGIRISFHCLERIVKEKKAVCYTALAIVCAVYLINIVSFMDYYLHQYPYTATATICFSTEYSNLLVADDGKKTYIDCEGGYYVYFLYSLKPDPYEYNLPERTTNEFGNYVLGLELDESARYIVHVDNDNFRWELLVNGFEEIGEEGFFVLYEKVSG